MPNSEQKIANNDEPLKPIEELRKITDPRDASLPVMSLSEIAKADGKGKTNKAYVACKETIYDVSKNDVYREGGGYHCFVGKDASVALGKMQFNPEFMDPH
mmetsp:Transcript_5900/g.4207  ORF Transcript_5900/g.4207 Transcript_5900/m.4207 type:complete len:101 (+) Transcript_5900:155-457(+)